jgi:NAD-dependent DNA ligase
MKMTSWPVVLPVETVCRRQITTNIKQIRSVPLFAAFSRYGIEQVEIRGEALINKENFRNTISNWRNNNSRPLPIPVMRRLVHSG